MNKKILVVLCVGIASVISGCNGGSNTSAQNMPVGGVFNMTYTPGIYSASNSGNGCANNFSDSGLLYPQSSISYGTNSGAPVNGILYYGYFTNPVNQNNPCFTGTVGKSDPVNNYPAIPSQCTNANGGTLKFFGCSVMLVGNHYQFNATYQILQGNGVVLQGTVSGQQ